MRADRRPTLFLRNTKAKRFALSRDLVITKPLDAGRKIRVLEYSSFELEFFLFQRSLESQTQANSLVVVKHERKQGRA